MLIGLISDIHGNLEALRTVLSTMDDLGVEEILCAGDIVGYGADPVECVGLVAERVRAAVAGNHEGGVLCAESNFFFNRVAREVAKSHPGKLISRSTAMLPGARIRETRPPRGRWTPLLRCARPPSAETPCTVGLAPGFRGPFGR